MGQAIKDSLKAYIKGRIEAAERGEREAYYDLGLMYSIGQGVAQDFTVAHKWFNLAAMRGMKRAVVDRAEIATEMEPRQIAEAQREARDWINAH